MVHDDMVARVRVDVAPTTPNTYYVANRYLTDFIKAKFNCEDLSFKQLHEH